MVAPNNHDRVVPGWTLFERSQHVPDTIVSVADRREIGLHRGLVQARVLPNPRKVGRWLVLHASLRVDDILQIIEPEFRQLDGLQGMAVEILLRHVPRQVRLGDAERHEERLIRLFR